MLSTMERNQSDNRPFKQRKSLATRMREATDIRAKYPNKIPLFKRPGDLPSSVSGHFAASGLENLPASPFCNMEVIMLQTGWVVVERYRKEKALPKMDRIKFLVSQDISISQFIFTLRNRMSLSATQAFYLLVNNKSLPCLSLTVAEVYQDSKDEDGFLYVTYASQEMFGNCTHC